MLCCYVESCENPADIATRGQSAEKLKENGLWWNGPKWLSYPCKQWPSFNYNLTNEIQKQVEVEEKGGMVLFEAALAAEEEPVSPLGINEVAFSSHFRLTKMTAWCLRFIFNIKTKMKREKRKGALSVQEIKDASDLWLKHTQKNYFGAIIDSMKKEQETRWYPNLACISMKTTSSVWW